MLEEAGDESPAGTAPASRVVTMAMQLRKAGDLALAREMLESADRDNDEGAARLYVDMLDRLDDHAEMQVTLTGMIRRLSPKRQPSDDYLATLLRQAERGCLPLPVIGDALNFAKPAQDAGTDLGAAYRAVERRQAFRVTRAHRASRATVISIGMHCLPWTLLNRWGIRDSKQYVEDFNPFCLAIHKVAGVIEALRTDFATYMALSEMMEIRSAEGHAVAVRQDRNVVWNHNRGRFWAENQFRNLRANLLYKIYNFRRTCQAEVPVFVLGNVMDEYPKEELAFLPALQDALRAATGREKNYLIMTNQRPRLPRHAVFHVDSHTSFVHCPFPEKAYSWFLAATVDSASGIAYERAYVKSLFDCLRRWDLVGAPPQSAPPQSAPQQSAAS